MRTEGHGAYSSHPEFLGAQWERRKFSDWESSKINERTSAFSLVRWYELSFIAVGFGPQYQATAISYDRDISAKNLNHKLRSQLNTFANPCGYVGLAFIALGVKRAIKDCKPAFGLLGLMSGIRL